MANEGTEEVRRVLCTRGQQVKIWLSDSQHTRLKSKAAKRDETIRRSSGTPLDRYLACEQRPPATLPLLLKHYVCEQ
jgi:hypothetical protein